jgi:hypothetical protein
VLLPRFGPSAIACRDVYPACTKTLASTRDAGGGGGLGLCPDRLNHKPSCRGGMTGHCRHDRDTFSRTFPHLPLGIITIRMIRKKAWSPMFIIIVKPLLKISALILAAMFFRGLTALCLLTALVNAENGLRGGRRLDGEEKSILRCSNPYGNPCGPGVPCIDTDEGSFTCGKALNARGCPIGCGPHAECTNTGTGFECPCVEGYFRTNPLMPCISRPNGYQG